MQDIEQYVGNPHIIDQDFELYIQPDDVLLITISSKDEELLSPFSNSQMLGSTGSGTSLQETNGLQVDKLGYIRVPLLGEIKVSGMTRKEVENLLQEKLIAQEYVKDPVVQVRIKGFKISVMGEVSSPGIKEFRADRVTLLEALSAAGDLTPAGKRKNVTVIREENGARQAYLVDLTSARDVLTSSAYYMQQNDVVYVEPNKSIGVRSSSTLSSVSAVGSVISVLASIVSLVVVLSK